MMQTLTGYLGFASVGLFVIAFFVFATLTPGFDLVNDYISKLGAQGQPYAVWWNLIGFISVGILFSGFGWSFGRMIKDNVVGFCLILAGVGFAVGAIPTDFADASAPLSKAHFVSICLALAGWCLGLARMGHVGADDRLVQSSANITGVLAVLPFIGHVLGLFSAPVSHRLVLGVVFGWVVFASVRLLWGRKVT